MTNRLRQWSLALGAVSIMAVGSLAATTAPAAARVVCDDDGDDCYRTHPYGYGYDRDWDWHERHEWEERREAQRRWYWNQYRRPYDYGYYRGWERPYNGTSLWFNF